MVRDYNLSLFKFLGRRKVECYIGYDGSMLVFVGSFII